MEKEPINSEEYLSKVERIELKNLEGNFEESLLRISQPFKNFEIKEDGLEISEGEVKIEIKYAPHTYIRDGEKYVAKEAKEITSFLVNNGGKIIDLLAVIPLGTKIIIYPDADIENGHVMYPDEDGNRHIVIQGEICSPKMIAILIHEVGHIVDFKKLTELGVEKWVDDTADADIAEEVRRERTATAFALKVLRPFLKDETLRHDLLVFLNDSLGTYYHHAKNQLKKRREGVVENYTNHDFDDYNDEQDRF
jgi:hypothetical protein